MVSNGNGRHIDRHSMPGKGRKGAVVNGGKNTAKVHNRKFGGRAPRSEQAVIQSPNEGNGEWGCGCRHSMPTKWTEKRDFRVKI